MDLFCNLVISDFGFVSNFDIRISDFGLSFRNGQTHLSPPPQVANVNLDAFLLNIVPVFANAKKARGDVSGRGFMKIRPPGHGFKPHRGIDPAVGRRHGIVYPIDVHGPHPKRAAAGKSGKSAPGKHAFHLQGQPEYGHFGYCGNLF